MKRNYSNKKKINSLLLNLWKLHLYILLSIDITSIIFSEKMFALLRKGHVTNFLTLISRQCMR